MSAEHSDSYMPNLFSTGQTVTSSSSSHSVIPQNTYYDTSTSIHNSQSTRHVVIFGYSPSNRAEILKKIKSITPISRTEEGKNYVSVWCEDIEGLEKLIKLNQEKINGEIIGVFRKNFGVVETEDIYEKKKGMMNRIREYFIG